jgi:hypothetical protein
MLMLVLERAGKGRFCPFWHKQDGPAAKSQSNPCESNREAARRHAQVRAWRAGLTDSRAKGIQRWALAPPTVFWEEDRNCRYHPRFSAALAVVFSIDKRWGVQHPGSRANPFLADRTTLLRICRHGSTQPHSLGKLTYNAHIVEVVLRWPKVAFGSFE